MSESTLSLKKSDLMARVGAYLGWGRGADFGDEAWTDEEQFYLTDFVGSACRRVYQAAVGGKTYDWSWLRPTSTLTLSQGSNVILLPDDFGGMEGVLTLVPTTGVYLYPIKLSNDQQVLDRLSAVPTATGRPLMAAVRPRKGTGQDIGQRYELIFFPTADQDYQFRVSYYVLPDALTDDHPYALGGAGLAEVYLEGALAIAEQRLDNKPEDAPDAVHQKAFVKLLAAAIDQDRRNKPQTLGRNRDLSDERDLYDGMLRHSWQNPVSYDGVVYGG